MFKDLKIRTKIMLPTILTVLIVLLSSSVYSYFFNIKTIKTAVNAYLETTAYSRAHHVETVLKIYEERAKLLTSKIWLRKHLKSYYETGEELYMINVEEILEDLQLGNPNFLHISIINPGGEVIISTDKSSLGKDLSNKDFFISGKKDYTVSQFHKPEYDGSRLHISGPLIQDGEFLGVVSVGSDGKTLESAVTEYTGLGETGEIYLINKEGYMITPSRFGGDTFLETKIDTLQANLCIEEHVVGELETGMKETPQIYFDYRGKKVLGTHAYIPKMDWCLIVETHKSEALSSTRDLLRFSIIRILIVLFIFSIVTYILAKTISRPIIALHHGTEMIQKGDLNYKVGTDTKDEIGQLSRSFDKMTVAIKESRTNIDKKVKEQTKSLVRQQEETKKSRIQLERMNDKMIGRELKMVELKKEIQELKNKN